jgi:hypothetical protein
MKKLLFGINILIILFFALIAAKLLSTNLDNNIPTIKPDTKNKNLVLSDHLKNHNDIEINFPYQKFVASENYLTYKFLKEDIDQIAIKLKDASKTQNIIYAALTDSLLKIKPSLSVSNIDTLIKTFQWADKFRVFAEVDSVNNTLYLAINDFWMSKISDHLVLIAKENTIQLNDFKFRYLLTKCNEVKYNPAIKNSSATKFIQNLLKSNWAHLFHATWDQASKFQLFLILTFVIITTFSYVVLIKSIYKLIKK